jgi:hypothetical protein
MDDYQFLARSDCLRYRMRDYGDYSFVGAIVCSPFRLCGPPVKKRKILRF